MQEEFEDTKRVIIIRKSKNTTTTTDNTMATRGNLEGSQS